jgi:hypothetical protein
MRILQPETSSAGENSFHAFQCFVVSFQERNENTNVHNQSQFFATHHDLGQQTRHNCDSIQPDARSIQPLGSAAQTVKKLSSSVKLFPKFSWPLPCRLQDIQQVA